ncbi:MAG: hypothetical protein AAB649_07415 [Patescibacteria group bacterium]
MTLNVESEEIVQEADGKIFLIRTLKEKNLISEEWIKERAIAWEKVQEEQMLEKLKIQHIDEEIKKLTPK